MEVPRPYHIVWFDAAHAEQAMRLLEVLPEIERKERGRPHLFRMWESSVPYPNSDGTRSAKNCHCVAVDRYGSVALSPGGTQTREKDGKQITVCVVSDYCEQIIEIEDGLKAAHIKPETWELPEFKLAAKEAFAKDANLAKQGLALKEKRLQELNEDVVAHNEKAKRRFLNACGHMIMEKRDPKALDFEDLVDVLTIAEMNGATFPSLEAWMSLHGKPMQMEVEDKPYDPVAFLSHANAVMSAQGIERRKFQVELDADGKPIESTRRRIA